MTREVSGPLVLAVAGAVAAALLLLGLPRLVAHAIVAPAHEQVDNALTAGRALPPAVVDHALERYASAVPFAPEDASFRRRQGQLLLRKRAGAGPEEAAALMREARDRFAEAAARAPARSFDWTLFVRAELALGAKAGSLEPVLRLAYVTGPYEASSMLARSNIVLAHWEAFSPDMRDIVRADLERLWQTRGLRATLYRTYLQWGYRERGLFREIVLSDPEEARRFDRQFMRWLRTPRTG